MTQQLLIAATGGRSAPAATYVTTSSATTDPNGLSVPKTLPLNATPTSGDLILVMTIQGSGISSGYTQIGTTFTNDQGYACRAYYRISNGTEANVSVNCSDAVAIVLRGHSFLGAGAFVDGSSTTLTVSPDASTSGNDAVVLFAIDRNMTAMTAPAGFTRVGPGASSSYFSCYAYYKLSGNTSSAVSITGSGMDSTGIAITTR